MTIHRREFLEKATALLASAVTLPLVRQGGTRGRATRIAMGAQTNAWGNPIQNYHELLKILDTLAQLNYRGFETNYRSLHSEASRAAQCRRDFEVRQVRLIALHCPSKFYEKNAVAPQMELLRSIAAYSREMGARYQIVSGGTWPHTSGHLDLEAVHVWTDALNQLGKAVKEEGLTLCYHNHRTEFEGEPSPMSYFLRDTDPDLVRLNFDVGHPIGLIDPAAFSAEHFRRIAIYHLKDTVLDSSGTVSHTDLGKGHVDLKGVVAPLLDSDWSGWLEIEEDRVYPQALEHPAATLREDRQYLKRITGV